MLVAFTGVLFARADMFVDIAPYLCRAVVAVAQARRAFTGGARRVKLSKALVATADACDQLAVLPEYRRRLSLADAWRETVLVSATVECSTPRQMPGRSAVTPRVRTYFTYLP